MTSYTPNLAMPLLFAAQSQKEILHNEAIVVLDAITTGSAEALANDPSALTPAEGQLWIVGPDPVGAWSGRAGALALFTAGGWRFVSPLAGMRVYDRAAAMIRFCNGTIWTSTDAVAAPAGGDIIDAEARAALSALLIVLRTVGLQPAA
ncbi:DUF2793 domain-containing protein [Blastomonas sp.]|uniref:DUF2793 domain-containing protein n=1 Tax=Blastomonas sp. TaxID=1909299 RepID=UPI003594822A